MMKLQTMPLKFRVWDKEEERFYTLGDLMPGLEEPAKSDNKLTLHELLELQKSFAKVSLTSTRFIISQDTGVKDRDGKSIFTGNIVKLREPGGEFICTIECRDGACKAWWKNGLCESLAFNFRVEVIGNIWENPELLEEK